jgi:membrane fusion protein (multidrug efflux system)
MKTYFFTTYSLIILIALSSCGGHPAEAVKEATAPSVATIKLHRAGLSEEIHLPGELKAFEEVDLYAKLNSFVKEVLVDRGSSVKKGQVLILLDAPELDAQYQEANEKLRSKESVFRSSSSYYKRLLLTSRTPGTVSANDLEQSDAKMMADSADVSSARAAFNAVSDLKNYLVVKAPFDGVISERNVHPGAFVGASGKGTDMPMLRLVEEGKLRLVVAVPEVNVGGLMVGQPVKFQVKAFPADTFSAQIKRISGDLDRKTRTELIEMDAENTDHRLLAGMYAEVEIGMKRGEPSFVVPASAVFTNTEGVFVIRVKSGKAEWVSVKKGNKQDKLVEVFGSLSENDELVEKASDQVRNGQELK